MKICREFNAFVFVAMCFHAVSGKAPMDGEKDVAAQDQNGLGKVLRLQKNGTSPNSGAMAKKPSIYSTLKKIDTREINGCPINKDAQMIQKIPKENKPLKSVYTGVISAKNPRSRHFRNGSSMAQFGYKKPKSYSYSKKNLSEDDYYYDSNLCNYESGEENYKEMPGFDKRGLLSNCSEKNTMVLTFDDGPSEHTPRLLDTLARENVKATFFVLGENLESSENQKTLKRIYREGHTIASHTWSHSDLRTLSDSEIRAELNNTSSLIQSIIGVYPVYMRPPYGYVDERVKKVIFNMGFKIITWNLDMIDWDINNRNPYNMPYELDSVLWHFKNVQREKSWIYLQHDIFETTVDVQASIIKTIKKHNYKIVPLRRCIGLNYGPYA